VEESWVDLPTIFLARPWRVRAVDAYVEGMSPSDGVYEKRPTIGTGALTMAVGHLA